MQPVGWIWPTAGPLVPPGPSTVQPVACPTSQPCSRAGQFCGWTPLLGSPGGGGSFWLLPPLRGYDPYNPELPKPLTQGENGALSDITESTPSILQLELVNKAIEAVKNEVEREQKKYEELLETTKEYSTSEASSLIPQTPVSSAVTKTDSFTSLEYNPGSYNLNNNTDYNPTPLAATCRSNKYTLDTTKSKGSSLEYVPKAVAQTKKYNNAVPNNKYVIDDSKPSTDLEYDPLSNYSARLLSKASTKEQKGTKRSRISNHEESYSPSCKKFCNISDDYETDARFSDSEDDADLEYQPTSSRSQTKVSSEKGGLPLWAGARELGWGCAWGRWWWHREWGYSHSPHVPWISCLWLCPVLPWLGSTSPNPVPLPPSPQGPLSVPTPPNRLTSWMLLFKLLGGTPGPGHAVALPVHAAFIGDIIGHISQKKKKKAEC
uniref:Uncharacterized protein n=1 Tax=Crocodylus porosus TaxID=8502 RepID=A0A7M4EPJ1_CROPO